MFVTYWYYNIFKQWFFNMSQRPFYPAIWLPPRSTWSHFQEGSITQPMLIIYIISWLRWCSPWVSQQSSVPQPCCYEQKLLLLCFITVPSIKAIGDNTWRQYGSKGSKIINILWVLSLIIVIFSIVEKVNRVKRQ